MMDSNADAYYIDVGDEGVGTWNIDDQNTGLAQSYTVNDLPTDGRTIYVRLSTAIDGHWRGFDYTYLSGLDACPDDPNKTEPGVCGCGIPDDDSDGDGTPDCIDICPDDPEDDPDGDGICGTTTPGCEPDAGAPPPANALLPFLIVGVPLRRWTRRWSE